MLNEIILFFIWIFSSLLTTINSMLQFAFWNITGFNVNKILEFVDSYDILGLVETWTHTDSPINLPGFNFFHLPGTKRKEVKKGRRSGGIILYYSINIERGITLVSKKDYGLWIKLDKTFFKQDFDIYLSVLYIKPQNPNVDSGEMFDNLNKDITEYPNHGKIILLGDFNCRTGEQADHIINDTLFNRADNNILPETHTCDKEIVRKNCDKTINSRKTFIGNLHWN